MTHKEWRNYERKKKAQEEFFAWLNKNNPHLFPPEVREHYNKIENHKQNSNLIYFLVAIGILVLLALAGGR